MDVVTEWLAPTILSELEEAIRWKERSLDGDASSQSEKTALYEDDRSNLRVECSTAGVVQVIKFINLEKPVRCVISDRSTRIVASISSATTERFEQEEKQRFTEDRVGGLIHIKAFEIVATHFGPRPDRLTLLVKDLECLGSDGSAACGMPRAIESVDNEKDRLLDRLVAIREKEKPPASQRPALERNFVGTATPQRASRDLFMPNRTGQLATQVEFATQVPRMSPLSPSSERQSDRSLDEKGEYATIVDSSGVQSVQVNDQSKTSKQVGGAELNRNLRPVERKLSANGRQPQVRDMSVLINLLAAKSQPQTDNKSGVLELESPRQIGPPSTHSESLVRVNGSVAHGAERSFDSTKMPSEPGERSRLDCVTSSSTAGPCVEPQVLTNCPVTDEKASHNIISKAQARNQRISIRDVRIPKDQEAVLDRSDSWLPAHPGGRNPVANIPTGILQNFNRDADDWKQRNSLEQKNTDLGVSKGADSDDSPQSDSESSSSSYCQWSPTPERESLPPDSSAPATDQSEGETKRRTTGSPPTVDQNTRNSSTANSVVDSVKPHGKTLQASLLPDRHATSPTTRSLQSTLRVRMQDSEPHGNELGSSLLECSSRQVQSQQCASNPLHAPAINAPEPSQSDSDIELVVPVALKESIQSRIDLSAQPLLTSSASQSEAPFTQVKNTPYGHSSVRQRRHSHIANDMQKSHTRAQSPSPHAFSSPARAFSQSPTHLQADSEYDGLAAGIRNVPILKSIENDAQAGPSEIVYLSQAAHPTMRKLCGTETRGLSEKPAKDPLGVMPSSPRNSRARSESKGESVGLVRKRSASKISGPAQTKRLRTCLLPPALKLSQLPDDLPDPAISARQNRQSWFAAQRNSASSTNTENLLPAVEKKPLPRQEDEMRRPGHEANPPTATTRCVRADSEMSKVPSTPHMSKPEYMSCSPDSGSERRAVFEAISTDMNESAESLQLSTAKEVSVKLTGDPMEFARSVSGFEEQPNTELQSHFDIDKRNATASNTTLERKTDSVPRTLFQKFKATYVDYSGDFDHFVSLCRKLDKLEKSNRPLHRSLWDDFIIRHSSDYRDYLFKCYQTADDPISYEKFYHALIEEPVFTKKVLRIEDFRGASKSNVPLRALTTVQSNRSVPRNRVNTSAEILCAEDPPSRGSRRSTPKVTVDLTDDDPKSLGSPNGVKMQPLNSSREVQKRNLPWANPRRHNHSAPDSQQNKKERTLHEPVRLSGAPSAQPNGNLRRTSHTSIAPKGISSLTDSRRQDTEGRPIGEDQQTSGKSTKASAPQKEHHWWHDEDTPFKTFARNYAAIRPGNGNSFAKATTTLRTEATPGRGSRPLGDLDVLDWDL